MLDLVAMLLWWAGVALGVVVYLLLHRFAENEEQGFIVNTERGVWTE